MSDIYFYSKYGDGLYFVTELMKEGKRVFTFIESKDYKHILDGMITKYESLTYWINSIKKDDIVVFDYNTKQGVDTYKKLKQRGINNIIGGSEFAYKLEHDREYAMRLLASNGILIPDTYPIKSNAEGITFIKSNEGKYVYKPNGENTGSAETYVARNGKDIIDFIQARPDQSFILQKFVPDAICEIGIEAYFSKGNLVNGISHTIETKKFMPGNKGCNTGCMSSVSWFDTEDNNELFDKTWKNILEVFKKEEYTGPCDISGIIDKLGDFYALELTPRFGYSQDINLYRLLEELISTFWESLATGKCTEIERNDSMFACTGRGSIPPYPLEPKKGLEQQTKDWFKDTENTPVIYEQNESCDYFLIDVKKNKKNEIVTAGINGIVCEIATKDTDIMKAQKRICKAMDGFLMGDFQFRIDMFDDAFKQIPKLKELGLFFNVNL